MSYIKIYQKTCTNVVTKAGTIQNLQDDILVDV